MTAQSICCRGRVEHAGFDRQLSRVGPFLLSWTCWFYNRLRRISEPAFRQTEAMTELWQAQPGGQRMLLRRNGGGVTPQV